MSESGAGAAATVQEASARPLPDEVIVEHILTRVPAAATVRFRAVCRDWRAALTSDHFVQAYQAARAAAQPQPPEIFFFAPGAAADSTSFYSSLKFRAQQDASSPARELVTVGDLRANDLVLSGTKPCRGLTLLYQPGESAYHVCNLYTRTNFSGKEEHLYRTPEPILSLSVDTERFGWVAPPGRTGALRLPPRRARRPAVRAVVDTRLVVERYELWVRPAAGPTTPSWSLRCRISLASLPRPMREALSRGIRMLPLGSWGGKILLATRCTPTTRRATAWTRCSPCRSS
ncbi:hypothetical protein C2845_PM12G06550 [Panicum miliaceum]|uniref:F-box domain-containing protein n=1 Tax=Panicum miliaceum TaxID=4540 RepID=A0A3L6QJ41_PANMI|nr:hypothetical protein C2845_PM12G06550 [Panicum miliaceum]